MNSFKKISKALVLTMLMSQVVCANDRNVFVEGTDGFIQTVGSKAVPVVKEGFRSMFWSFVSKAQDLGSQILSKSLSIGSQIASSELAKQAKDLGAQVVSKTSEIAKQSKDVLAPMAKSFVNGCEKQFNATSEFVKPYLNMGLEFAKSNPKTSIAIGTTVALTTAILSWKLWNKKPVQKSTVPAVRLDNLRNAGQKK